MTDVGRIQNMARDLAAEVNRGFFASCAPVQRYWLRGFALELLAAAEEIEERRHAAPRDIPIRPAP